MKKSLKIVIIGAGNVAEHVSQSFLKHKNIQLIQLFNHQFSKRTKTLATKLKCDFVMDYSEINRDADLYIIAVKDDAIQEVVKSMKTLKLEGLVVHTSGSVDQNVLKGVSKSIGVYYPLQTFYPKAKIDWQSTPILIEANAKDALLQLKTVAKLISKKVKIVNSADRLKLHLAAVFACNFTNAMYVAAYEIIEKNFESKDTGLLFPIMQHSFQKLAAEHPLLTQTGPAMRGDKRVMKKHLELLKDEKELSILYKSLSGLIEKQQTKIKRNN